MWLLEPIQVYFSYVLIRLGLNSIQVTVLWLLVAFAGYAVTAIGTPIAIIGGVLLLYIKTILDGADGEVARFHKQFITPQEDMESFINGVYLDKVFHIIEKPFWGLSLGLGMYFISGDVIVLIAGLLLGLFHTFTRHNGVVQSELAYKFQEPIQRLQAQDEFELPPVDPAQKDSILVRILDKLTFYIRNGKIFNMAVLFTALVDLMFPTQFAGRGATYLLVCAAGSISPFLCFYVMIRTVCTKQIVHRSVKMAEKQ